MNATVRRPISRYHGGKWKLADWIVSHLPAHRVYVEPFGGAASVLMRKPRSYAEIYNDLDSELVNLSRVARDEGDRLQRALELTPFARDEFRLSYEHHDDPVEQARRTVARAFMGFGTNAPNRATGFRAVSNASGTTPAHDWRNYPGGFAAVVQRLQGVVIENRDALDMMSAQDGPDTVFYVDPPYVPETRDRGWDYRFEMTLQDHEALSTFLHNVKGAVVLSGYASALYDRLYVDWRQVMSRAYADGGLVRTEVLWLSPRCPPSGLFDDWWPQTPNGGAGAGDEC
ncbi:DNA methyltransferase [Burkholderia multivorans]|uniref:DNA adenine methylase n=1 Tax=Burkholderia multivorans TaxID=87883 RepID=UPI000D011837|nr:DNA adenine methylase [Burkholderia multivorans]PRG58066.1 DNA methyltransferase [Burkholderia multivorans]